MRTHQSFTASGLQGLSCRAVLFLLASWLASAHTFLPLAASKDWFLPYPALPLDFAGGTFSS